MFEDKTINFAVFIFAAVIVSIAISWFTTKDMTPITKKFKRFMSAVILQIILSCGLLFIIPNSPQMISSKPHEIKNLVDAQNQLRDQYEILLQFKDHAAEMEMILYFTIAFLGLSFSATMYGFMKEVVRELEKQKNYNEPVLSLNENQID